MKKKISKKQLVANKNQDTRQFVIENSLYNTDKIINSFTETMDENIGKGTNDDMCQQFVETSMALGLNTHLPVADSVPKEFRSFLVSVTKETERDYNCDTAPAKALAQTIALCHVRIICYTKRLNEMLPNEVSPHKSKNGYYELLGKEIERTQRQLNSTTLTLKQLTTQTQPLNVKANTAFIAQNQQFNHNETND